MTLAHDVVEVGTLDDEAMSRCRLGILSRGRILSGITPDVSTSDENQLTTLIKWPYHIYLWRSPIHRLINGSSITIVALQHRIQAELFQRGFYQSSLQ